MPNTADAIVRTPLRVRYHECDQQGVVFNAHYLAYADMASFDALKALFGSHAKLADHDVDLMVAESTVRYYAACRFDDQLVIATFAERIGSTSLVLRFEMFRDAELVAMVTNRYVWINPHTMRPVRPPDEVRDAFAAHVVE